MANPPQQFEDVLGLPNTAEGAARSAAMGMAASLEEMERAFATIHTLPIEEQAKYADTICRSNAANPDWTNSQILRAPITGYSCWDYLGWNTTSVGNMAYMALHCEPVADRAYFRAVLTDYTQWRTTFNKVAIATRWIVGAIVASAVASTALYAWRSFR